MNFFEHQRRAHRQSLLLIVLFVVAVGLLTGVVSLVVGYSYLYGGSSFHHHTVNSLSDLGSGFFLLTTLGTLIIIVGATLWKLSQLSRGGRVVAEMLGGELVDPGSNDPARRRLINVVEEMSIASGTRVPAVYLLEGDSINAFAAGFTPNQAVIGVTRGCMELLSRDELQGVVAHEFSHILNGDMRLNMRLVGVLHGILVIGLLGQALMRGTFKRSRYRYRYLDSDPARRRGGGGAVQTFMAGLALMTVGYLGVLLGNLIKSALSRQREFLADASAVQFTRNPDGIANALRKIRSHVPGARLSAPSSEQFSHLFFGEAVSSGFTNLLSTHPPLAERIKRIRPRFVVDRDPPPGVGIEQLNNVGEIPRFNELAVGDPASVPLSAMSDGLAVPSAEAWVASVGAPGPEHLRQAEKIHAAIPAPLVNAAHDGEGARALLLALVSNRNSDLRKRQWRQLTGTLDEQAQRRLQQCFSQLEGLSPRLRLPLLDMALPAVSVLERPLINKHLLVMRQMIKAEQPVAMEDYVVFAIARAQLAPATPLRRASHGRLQPLIGDVMVVTALLARMGHADTEEADRAFTEAMTRIGVTDATLPGVEVATVAMLERSLRNLNGLALMPKMKLISALATAVLYDQQVTVDELELLRAICEILGCPVPTLPPAS